MKKQITFYSKMIHIFTIDIRIKDKNNAQGKGQKKDMEKYIQRLSHKRAKSNGRLTNMIHKMFAIPWLTKKLLIRLNHIARCPHVSRRRFDPTFILGSSSGRTIEAIKRCPLGTTVVKVQSLVIGPVKRHDPLFQEHSSETTQDDIPVTDPVEEKATTTHNHVTNIQNYLASINAITCKSKNTKNKSEMTNNHKPYQNQQQTNDPNNHPYNHIPKSTINHTCTRSQYNTPITIHTYMRSQYSNQPLEHLHY